jgi:hypothetical protein
MRIVDGYMAAAVPHNIMEGFKNAGISLIFDDGRIIQCQTTLETARCFIRAPFPDLLTGIELEDDEDGSDDPNVEIRASEMSEILGSEGE